MTMSRRILYMVLGGIMALAVVGAAMVGGTAVFAQDDEAPATPPAEVTVPLLPGDGFRGRPDSQGQHLDFQGQRFDFQGQRPQMGRFGDWNSYLADALGITVAELETAQETARAAIQAQAIEDGLITQEQVDLMAAGQALREYIDQGAAWADLLGLSVEELEAAREDGTIRDLIAASGLTQEEIMTAMQEAHETAVAQAVADGVITQEQADQLQNAPGRGNFGGQRGGRGQGQGRGGFGGQRGSGSGGPNSNAPIIPNA